jgi:hypothetical protein
LSPDKNLSAVVSWLLSAIVEVLSLSGARMRLLLSLGLRRMK